ncbi:hypothetical protein ACFSL6_27315 [Paenibacillus thailandensis]|uniref:Uncharacterized protein n=1 Tax=Paenibacillus thailandensis TaxID=393250 RepID=A0ABW5QQY7_9BACL
MFLGLYQTDPFWLIWTAVFNFAMLIILYGEGVLLVVYKDRYYGATATKIITDISDQYFRDQEYMCKSNGNR